MSKITGAHVIIYSADADADRAFLRDVLGFPHVDVGSGWLIFALPASEVAIHPAEKGGVHTLYLMVDDVTTFVARMADRGVTCSAPQNQGWGVLTQVSLPGGGELGIYEPRHARPTWPEPRKAGKRKATKSRKTKSPKRRPARRATAARKTPKPAGRARRRTRR
jgi:catechol 2,3-dioxygenase-like lactoylglutathione lyase family enzyme